MATISKEKLEKIVFSCRTEEQLNSCKRLATRVKEIDLSDYDFFYGLILNRNTQLAEAC